MILFCDFCVNMFGYFDENLLGVVLRWCWCFSMNFVLIVFFTFCSVRCQLIWFCSSSNIASVNASVMHNPGEGSPVGNALLRAGSFDPGLAKVFTHLRNPGDVQPRARLSRSEFVHGFSQIHDEVE